jgi:putative hemolysin
VNGLFAGAEIALVALRTSRVQELVEAGSASARAALELRAAPERFLATVQVGITVVSATAAAFGGASIAERIAPLIEPLPYIGQYDEEIALTLVIAAVSYLSIVLGELVPKSLALHAAEQYALIAARPLRTLAWVARPLVWLLTTSSNIVLRPFGDRTTFTEARLSPEEIQHMVESAKSSGTLHPGAADIASRAIDFPTLTAFDVMVPRRDVVMVDNATPVPELRRLLAERPLTRMPVYEGNADNPVGYLNLKDLAIRSWRGTEPTLAELLRAPFFVPESARADELLRDMQRRREQLAIVVDERGGMAGIVTIEDLVEELVGEIFSEHAQDAVQLKLEADGSALVPGAMPVREINRLLPVELPEDDAWNTIAGLCIGFAQRIPATGDRIELPKGIVLEIVDASARRVRMVRIRPPEEVEDGGEAEGKS